MYEYRAVIRSVHDGDSLRADIDLGFGIWTRNQALRLYGLDAPELGTDAGRAARDWLRLLLPLGTEVTIRTEKDRGDKYGRWLATVNHPMVPVSVNDAAVVTGHAKPWDGQGARP
jgi:micrococcal nuclease